jgi:hypothetical protein
MSTFIGYRSRTKRPREPPGLRPQSLTCSSMLNKRLILALLGSRISKVLPGRMLRRLTIPSKTDLSLYLPKRTSLIGMPPWSLKVTQMSPS